MVKGFDQANYGSEVMSLTQLKDSLQNADLMNVVDRFSFVARERLHDLIVLKGAFSKDAKDDWVIPARALPSRTDKELKAYLLRYFRFTHSFEDVKTELEWFKYCKALNQLVPVFELSEWKYDMEHGVFKFRLEAYDPNKIWKQYTKVMFPELTRALQTTYLSTTVKDLKAAGKTESLVAARNGLLNILYSTDPVKFLRDNFIDKENKKPNAFAMQHAMGYFLCTPDEEYVRPFDW